VVVQTIMLVLLQARRAAFTDEEKAVASWDLFVMALFACGAFRTEFATLLLMKHVTVASASGVVTFSPTKDELKNPENPLVKLGLRFHFPSGADLSRFDFNLIAQDFLDRWRLYLLNKLDPKARAEWADRLLVPKDASYHSDGTVGLSRYTIYGWLRDLSHRVAPKLAVVGVSPQIVRQFQIGILYLAGKDTLAVQLGADRAHTIRRSYLQPFFGARHEQMLERATTLLRAKPTPTQCRALALLAQAVRGPRTMPLLSGVTLRPRRHRRATWPRPQSNAPAPSTPTP